MSVSSQNVVTGTGFICQPETNIKKQARKKTNKIYKEWLSDMGPQAEQNDYPGESRDIRRQGRPK